MGKTYHKSKPFYDEPLDDDDDERRKDYMNKRRKKRFDRALKTKNIDELLEYGELEEDEETDF